MTQVDAALATLTAWLMEGLAILQVFFSLVDERLHRGLSLIGVPNDLQALLILLADIVLIILVVRVFGGALRLLAMAFLILLLLHVAAPGVGV